MIRSGGSSSTGKGWELGLLQSSIPEEYGGFGTRSAVTQKGVELLGPLGYSSQLLLEKWMRDAKINDLFEGTEQINRLVVARRILGYRSRELK